MTTKNPTDLLLLAFQLALFASACRTQTCEIPGIKPHFQGLPSGRTIQVIRQQSFVSEAYGQTLLFEYIIDHRQDDATMEKEVEEIWLTLRPTAEHENATRVTISPQWIMNEDACVWAGRPFVFIRDKSGAWIARSFRTLTPAGTHMETKE